MTRTAERLRQLGRPHARARAAAMLLLCGGTVLAIAAAGVWLAPRALLIVICWIAMLGVVAVSFWAARRARRGANAPALARLVEQAAEIRMGSVLGAMTPGAAAGTSPELLALADQRAARLVADAAPRVQRVLARSTRRGLALGGAVACVGAALFVAASPARGRAAFWHPLKALADAGAPVRLGVDHDVVRRGDSVLVTIEVPSALEATLWTRGMGEPWRAMPVSLDADGQGSRKLGPLEADLYLKATSGSRRSRERKVAVALPAFIAELVVVARYPAYLGREERQIVPGPDTIPLPAGTEVWTSGALSVGARGAVWTRQGGGESARLTVRGDRFTGRLVPTTSGTWRLDVVTADGAPLETGTALPELHLRLVPDSAPTVSVPVPGRDTMLPINLRQPLVIDVRDDHGITRVEVVSWRASQTGKIGEPVRQGLDVSGAGDRALIQGVLEAERRGLLPGDTLRFRVEAWDNAPEHHKGQSPEFALRLPSLEELRAATRAATSDIGAAADSLVAAQGALSDRTRDLAQERSRDAAGSGRRAASAQSGALPFEATERAAAIRQQQTDVETRARQLTEQVQQVARAAQAAGLTDTAFQARLAEVRQLLQRALSPELEQRLRELQDALSRLDPEATRNALQRLVEAQGRLREELERSRDLFRRAAIEGALASLAADAQDLQRRQAEWNGTDARQPDTAGAARESALAARADSLAHGIATTAQDLAQATSPEGATPLADPQAAAERARGAMGRAATAAAARQSRAAGSAGAAAESSLAEIPGELRNQRDSIVRGWRQETIDALDRALTETADLTARQRDVAEALRRGDTSAATRSLQASIEEGTSVVGKEIRAAEARHALVSPMLERALGFAQHQMRATQDQLGEANPGLGTAATLAGQSVDALNATAHAIARSRRAVSEAKSGTGFAEAMEQLMRLAGQQGDMNGQAEGLLPMAAAGGEAVMEQLRAIAAQQRALADQLDRMRAEGVSSAAGSLAKEAQDLAAQLEAGRLDARTIQRQSLLYHRLLDAGRTLNGSDPDDQKERVSQAATIDSVSIPPALLPGATGAGPRLRYPTWDELHDLTPEQRRLVLEYFRRLNAPGTGGRH